MAEHGEPRENWYHGGHGMRPQYLRVVFYERDSKTLGVSEVVTDDTEAAERTAQLLEAGRRVSMSITQPVVHLDDDPSVEEIGGRAPKRYRYDPELRW